MSVVDSSGWIEFLLGTENGARFRPQVESPDLAVPSIVISEVRRWMLSSRRFEELEEVTALISGRKVVPLDVGLAASAADLGIRHRLPLADSIVYATARSLGLEVWTQDRDFQGLTGVQYIPKRP